MPNSFVRNRHRLRRCRCNRRVRPCDTLELNLCKGDGTEENWSYHLNAAEQEVLARKMEAFCQQQTGMSLHEYAQQFQEEPGPTPQIQI